eukprot:Gb_35822 [translate_table: standard]
MCQNLSQDKRDHISFSEPHETTDGQQSVKAVTEEDGREVCTNPLEDNYIELHCQQNEVLKKLETFASQVNILQERYADKENHGQVIEKCLVLDEDKRELIAQKMAKGCQNDSKLRNTLLESLNVLVEGGLFHSLALKLLSQGSCEEAQEVVNMLDRRKKECNSDKSLLSLLHAVEKLHKAGDAFESVSHLQNSNLFALRHINQSSWEVAWHAVSQQTP